MSLKERKFAETKTIEGMVASVIQLHDLQYDKGMTDDELYTACLSVIKRAAELYSEIYDVEQEELISEANLAFCGILPFVRINPDDEARKLICQAIVAGMSSYCNKVQFEADSLNAEMFYEDKRYSDMMLGMDFGKALGMLKAKDADIIRMWMQGYDFVEIGKYYDIKPGSAEQYFRVAMRHLRYHLNKCNITEEYHWNVG